MTGMQKQRPLSLNKLRKKLKVKKDDFCKQCTSYLCDCENKEREL